ncbi:MAG: zinc metallopeptidase, partial [Oscillospiraceae bacterium]|nr:zinc metallopeptidase [Oscillospiraceae bacterium]
MPYYYYPTRYGYGGSGLWLVLICALFALWASHNVNSTFKKYAQQFSRRRITGAQAAQRVL